MKKFTKSFTTGAIALVFAVLGYQSALLVHYASVSRIAANRDKPDTVYIKVRTDNLRAGSDREDNLRAGTAGAAAPNDVAETTRYRAWHSAVASRVRETVPPSSRETFPFNPNTVSLEDFIRLGFSAKQAESIDKYRKKGGRFHRKSDFAKSYVVSDEMFKRLEPYIDIPKIDLNEADSAAFDSLPGIGGYFARKMVELRRRLRGYSCQEQLLDIPGFDSTRLAALDGLISIKRPAELQLWGLPEDSLRLHPYIGRSAHGIVLFRNNNPKAQWNLNSLRDAGVLDDDQLNKLALCNCR